MGNNNGQKFSDFQQLTDSQKLDYLYLEIQGQKSDLRWYVTIFGGILLAAYEFGKALVKRKFGLDG